MYNARRLVKAPILSGVGCELNRKKFHGITETSFGSSEADIE